MFPFQSQNQYSQSGGDRNVAVRTGDFQGNEGRWKQAEKYYTD